MVMATPATVSTPLRSAPVFAATPNRAMPPPLPPVVMAVIHGTFKVAAQTQPADGTVTVTLPSPPALVNEVVAAAAVNSQPGVGCGVGPGPGPGGTGPTADWLTT